MQQVLREDQDFNQRRIKFEMAIRHLSSRQLGIGICGSDKMIGLEIF